MPLCFFIILRRCSFLFPHVALPWRQEAPNGSNAQTSLLCEDVLLPDSNFCDAFNCLYRCLINAFPVVSSILNSAHFHLWALAVGKMSWFFSYGKPTKKKKSIHLNQGYVRILLTLNPTSKNSDDGHQYLESYLILCSSKPWSNIIMWLLLQWARSQHWTHLKAEAVIYRCALDKICNMQSLSSFQLLQRCRELGKQKQRRMDWIWWTLIRHLQLRFLWTALPTDP